MNTETNTQETNEKLATLQINITSKDDLVWYARKPNVRISKYDAKFKDDTFFKNPKELDIFLSNLPKDIALEITQLPNGDLRIS